jgi:phosphoribosylanthranilate isomerase
LRTRIKICGITNIEDALLAIQSGVDALGFVFYPPSPRHISIENANDIIKQLPPFVTTVALFVDEQPLQIKKTIDLVKIDLLQFHGNENEKFCQQFNRPYIKAIRMKEDCDLQQSIVDFSSAKALLLDTYVKGTPGGTGESFNWDLLPKQRNKAIILAGGLNADNISLAIKTVTPYAVDISGGVEQDGIKNKGMKDHKKIQTFINNVLLTDRN